MDEYLTTERCPYEQDHKKSISTMKFSENKLLVEKLRSDEKSDERSDERSDKRSDERSEIEWQSFRWCESGSLHQTNKKIPRLLWCKGGWG